MWTQARVQHQAMIRVLYEHSVKTLMPLRQDSTGVVYGHLYHSYVSSVISVFNSQGSRLGVDRGPGLSPSVGQGFVLASSKKLSSRLIFVLNIQGIDFATARRLFMWLLHVPCVVLGVCPAKWSALSEAAGVYPLFMSIFTFVGRSAAAACLLLWLPCELLFVVLLVVPARGRV